jgi:GNAT superfamily N-acetyltransferase
MKKIRTIDKFVVCQLAKEVAMLNATKLTKLVDSIPLVDYTEADVLADSKPGRSFLGKWEHSLVVFDSEEPVAVIMGYEREAENNDLYPANCLYISELAVAANYQRQGLAGKLVAIFLDYNKALNYLSGPLVYAIQTNSADWNQHVIRLYKSFGFEQVGTKVYENRTDVVLRFISSN